MGKATRAERSDLPDRRETERDVGIPSDSEGRNRGPTGRGAVPHSRVDRPEKEPSLRQEGPKTPAHGSEHRGKEGQYLRGRRTGLEK